MDIIFSFTALVVAIAIAMYIILSTDWDRNGRIIAASKNR